MATHIANVHRDKEKGIAIVLCRPQEMVPAVWLIAKGFNQEPKPAAAGSRA
jgi:hypothetical protein